MSTTVTTIAQITNDNITNISDLDDFEDNLLKLICDIIKKVPGIHYPANTALIKCQTPFVLGAKSLEGV